MPRGVPNKPRSETNPDCTNPACIVTCNDQCPNLKANIDHEREQAAAREERDPLQRDVVMTH